MKTRTLLLTCTVAGLSLALLPASVHAGPVPASPTSASATADTPAVAAVRQFLADRSAGNSDAAYALLSAGSRRAVSAEDFAAGPPPSAAAEVSNSARRLSTTALGLLALLADPHHTLGCSFTVIGPDPADSSVVLVRVTPPVGAVKLPTASAPETGTRHAAILRLLTVADPTSHQPRVAVEESLEKAALNELTEEREQEHKTEALAQLEQISVGIIRYANDHHGVMPDADTWTDEILPYVKDPAVFHAPFALPGEEWSYAYNRALSHKPTAQIESPAHTVMLFESTLGTKNASDTGQSVPLPGRHLSGTAYVTADGHAQWFPDGAKLSYRLDGK